MHRCRAKRFKHDPATLVIVDYIQLCPSSFAPSLAGQDNDRRRQFKLSTEAKQTHLFMGYYDKKTEKQ